MIIKKDKLYVCGFLTLFFISFLNADLGFSYDYKYYIGYIQEIHILTFNRLLYNLNGLYININLSSGLEAGFVFFIKLITVIISTPEVVYTIAATFSLVIKAYVMNKLNIYWPYILLVLTYSAILLEANALRSGLSLSFFILSIYFLLNKRNILYVSLLWLLAISFHLQSLIFIITFSLIYLLKCNRYGKRMTISLFIALIFLGTFISKIFTMVGNEKIIFYMSKSSGSGGINSISIISLILFFFVAKSIIQNDFFRANNIITFCVITSTIPALSMYAFLTDISVVGDRLWQWGLILQVIFLAPYYAEFRMWQNIKNPGVHLPKLLIITLLCVGIINITIRYPLSNLFNPIIPYQDLSEKK
jgi:hypothetical protein